MRGGVPVLIRDVGTVTLGPDIRRGVADLDGQGEVVSGIVVIRQNENALRVIDRVKAKLREIEPSLPPGVEVVTAYDRSELILASIDNLKRTLDRRADRGGHRHPHLSLARAQRRHPHPHHPDRPC